MEKKRSFGVTVFGAAMLFYSFIYLIIPFKFFLFRMPESFIGLLIFVSMFLSYFITAIGIFLLHEAARKAALFITIPILIVALLWSISAIGQVISNPAGGEDAGWGIIDLCFICILYLSLHVFFLFFLTRPKVKEQFKKQAL